MARIPAPVPEGSIYFWMYEQGLKGCELPEVELALAAAQKHARLKDLENFWRGWYNHRLYRSGSDDLLDMSGLVRPTIASTANEFLDKAWDEYEDHPFLYKPDVELRYVPCSIENKPMIKWGEGCMSLADARAMSRACYLAENLYGTQRIVVDCDGDHDERLDFDTIDFLWDMAERTGTHVLSKPKNVCEYPGYEGMGMRPASFHLTFFVDKVVPTMHFPWCHIDVVGNKRNSLRYFKNKQWNGRQPAYMTSEVWDELRRFVKGRKG